MDKKAPGSSLGATPGLAGKSPPLLRGTAVTSLENGNKKNNNTKKRKAGTDKGTVVKTGRFYEHGRDFEYTSAGRVGSNASC